MNPARRGRFITLEGIDGAGKSSHLPRLAKHFEGQGWEVVVTREPGGTPLAETLRELFLHTPMDALTETLLVFAARRDHVLASIEPALQRGAIVLCDRFTDATFAYQGFGRGFDLARLAQLESWVHGQCQPDLTLWFDVDPQVARARRGDRAEDRLEREAEDFHGRVREGYRQRSLGCAERFARIDAGLPPEQVWQQIETQLIQRPWR